MSGWTQPATDADPSSIIGLVAFFAIVTVTCVLWAWAERRIEARRREVCTQHIEKAHQSRRWNDERPIEGNVYDTWRGSRD